jgi:hypothetical protein
MKTLLCCVFLMSFALDLFVPTAACQATHVESGTTFDGPGGKIYYEVIGRRKEIPLVLVNGGPGLDHLYLHTSAA